jgi:hypothetical protein
VSSASASGQEGQFGTRDPDRHAPLDDPGGRPDQDDDTSGGTDTPDAGTGGDGNAGPGGSGDTGAVGGVDAGAGDGGDTGANGGVDAGAGNGGDTGTDGGVDADAGDGDNPVAGIADIDGLLDPAAGLIASLGANASGTLDLGLAGLGLDEIGGIGSGALDSAMPAVGALAGSVGDLGGSLLQTVGNTVGLPLTGTALDNFVDSLGLGNIGSDDGGGLIADVVNLPHDILDGGDIGDLTANILTDASDTIGTELADLVPSLLGDLGSPLINGDVAGDGDSSGSNIVNAGVGPQDDGGILLDVFTQKGSGSGDTGNVNVLDGPQLVNLDALNGSDSIILPALGGVDADSLNGLLGESSTGTGGAEGEAGATATLGIVDDVIADLDVDGLFDIGPIQTSSNQNGSLIQGLV